MKEENKIKKAETAAWEKSFEKESEEMLLADRYLTELKAEADGLYEDAEVYGTAGWEK